MAKLTVLIADDHPLMVRGIRGALAGVDDIEVVGETRSGAQVLPLIERTSPHLVLLDLRMPGLDGLLCLEQIRARFPKVKVVILSVIDDGAEIKRALESGASGFIVKSIDPVELPAALRQAVDATADYVGGLPPTAASDEAAEDTDLSKREVEILQAVARGLSNRAIAKELWLSDHTVKFHLRNIYRKLGVSNRTEAARYVYQRALPQTSA